MGLGINAIAQVKSSECEHKFEIRSKPTSSHGLSCETASKMKELMKCLMNSVQFQGERKFKKAMFIRQK